VAVARSVVLFWTFTMSNSKGRTDLGLARDRQFSMRRSGKPDLRVPFTRAKRAAGMHGIPVRSMRAQP
jgi:hypothetical protein